MHAAVSVLAFAASLAAQAASADLRRRVDEYLAPVVEQDLFSGAILLARGGEVLVELGYGMAQPGERRLNTAATRFKLMSISKTLVAAAVMRLVQDGRFALADPVAKYVPDCPPAWSVVTLHDLLDHTSGIPNLELQWRIAEDQAGARGRPVWAAFARGLQAQPLLSRPGTQQNYLNFNYELIGLALEFAHDKSLRDVLRATVLEPLGMAATGFDDGSRFPELAVGHMLGRDGQPTATQDDMSRIQAACGLYSTVGDLYRFDRALRAGTLIDAASHRRMVTARSGNLACSWINQPIHGRPCIRHSGGANGYAGDFLRFPDDDVTVIVLSNYKFTPVVPISEDLAAMLLRKKPAQPRRLDAATLGRCTGVFRLPDGEYLIVHRLGDKLIEYQGKDLFLGHALLPIGNGVFAEAATGDVRLEFDRGPARRVRRMIDGSSTVLERADTQLARWKAAAGPLVATPDFGKEVRLDVDGDRIVLQVGDWLPIEIVPLSETKAVALHDPLRGTSLQRDGNTFHLAIGEATFRLERRPAR